MPFANAIKQYWSNYATFAGRTSKSTYWWSVLFVVLADSVVQILFPSTSHVVEVLGMRNTVTNESSVYSLWQLATIIPSLALLVRRLHDTNRSGKKAWWMLLPVIGWIILLVYTLDKGTDGANSFGQQAN